jgi:hypothetical protein
VTVVVSARAGTTLSFMCGLHPWMQGKIVVTQDRRHIGRNSRRRA